MNYQDNIENLEYGITTEEIVRRSKEPTISLEELKKNILGVD